MAGKKGYSGPPGNANAFRHGLAAVQRRCSEGALTPDEQDIRADILAGLIADKGDWDRRANLGRDHQQRCGAISHFQSGHRLRAKDKPKGATKPEGLGPARRLQARAGEQCNQQSTAIRL